MFSLLVILILLNIQLFCTASFQTTFDIIAIVNKTKNRSPRWIPFAYHNYKKNWATVPFTIERAYAYTFNWAYVLLQMVRLLSFYGKNVQVLIILHEAYISQQFFYLHWHSVNESKSTGIDPSLRLYCRYNGFPGSGSILMSANSHEIMAELDWFYTTLFRKEWKAFNQAFCHFLFL